jgi:hypothetical protein
MKKLMTGLLLVGGFLLVSNLTFAQDAQPTAGGDSTVNQADSNNNPGAADMPSDVQTNSANAASDSGNTQ